MPLLHDMLRAMMPLFITLMPLAAAFSPLMLTPCAMPLIFIVTPYAVVDYALRCLRFRHADGAAVAVYAALR